MLQIRNLSVPPAKCCKSPSRPSTTFVPITNAKYCHNISSIHHLNQQFAKTQKPEDALVVAIETQNKRGNRFPFLWNAGNWSRPWRIFPLHPNRVPKEEEEEERMRVAVVNDDSTSETMISTNQSARSRRYAMGAVEKRRTSPPSCEDRK